MSGSYSAQRNESQQVSSADQNGINNNNNNNDYHAVLINQNDPQEQLFPSDLYKELAGDIMVWMICKTFMYFVIDLIGVLALKQSSGTQSEGLVEWQLLSFYYFGFKTIYLLASTTIAFTKSRQANIALDSGEMRSQLENSESNEQFKQLTQIQRKRAIEKLCNNIYKHVYERNLAYKIVKYADKILIAVLFIYGIWQSSGANTKMSTEMNVWVVFALVFLILDEPLAIGFVLLPFLLALFIVLFIPYQIHKACNREKVEEEERLQRERLREQRDEPSPLFCSIIQCCPGVCCYV